jgi:hypothetical protein
MGKHANKKTVRVKKPKTKLGLPDLDHKCYSLCVCLFYNVSALLKTPADFQAQSVRHFDDWRLLAQVD